MLNQYPMLRMWLYFVALMAQAVGAGVLLLDPHIGQAIMAGAAVLGTGAAGVALTNVNGLTPGSASSVRGMSIDLPHSADPPSGSSS